MDTKYQNGLHKQIIATTKLTHLRSNWRCSAIFASFLPFPRPRSSLQLWYPLANLHKGPEALACYYVTSHWQAEWVKIRRWKTIESPLLPPPPPPPCHRYICTLHVKKRQPILLRALLVSQAFFHVQLS